MKHTQQIAEQPEQFSVPNKHDRLRVLFVHPSYPNQFSAIGAQLNNDPHFQCCALVHQAFGPQVLAERSRMPHFGFQPDGQTNGFSYPYAVPFEDGMRNGRGIAHALLALDQAYHFDAIVGHAAFGSTLHLRDITNAAVISYAELPGYQTAMARPEFPITIDLLLSSQAYKALLYASMMHSDLCVAPSEHAKRLLPPELQAKTRVQMEGFDTENSPQPGPEERAALGLPKEAPLIGFFGRTLEAVRGFDVFVEVAKRLHASDPALQFLVVGEDKTLYGNERTYLGAQTFKSYALERADISERLFHWRQPMPYDKFRRHIACLDLAILPFFEGAANWNLFEAMAVGLPILASNRGYVPEAIRNGQDGLLFDPYDIERFVFWALQLLKDRPLAQRLASSARQRIRVHYSTEIAAAGYGRIIREAVARRLGRQLRQPACVLTAA
jgi:glycosyltransferase involved in cell wall biosynthesis